MLSEDRMPSGTAQTTASSVPQMATCRVTTISVAYSRQSVKSGGKKSLISVRMLPDSVIRVMGRISAPRHDQTRNAQRDGPTHEAQQFHRAFARGDRANSELMAILSENRRYGPAGKKRRGNLRAAEAYYRDSLSRASSIFLMRSGLFRRRHLGIGLQLALFAEQFELTERNQLGRWSKA